MDVINPCTQCGACCASYRVSFYWAEALVLPDSLTQQLNATYSCMTGTNSDMPRCQALQGTVGNAVSCNVYAQRPSPCREVQPGDEKCNTARARDGLAPLAVIIGHN